VSIYDERGEDVILTDGVTQAEAELDDLATYDPDSYWFNQRYDAARYAETGEL
jgi:hypothetical protein